MCTVCTVYCERHNRSWGMGIILVITLHRIMFWSLNSVIYLDQCWPEGRMIQTRKWKYGLYVFLTYFHSINYVKNKFLKSQEVIFYDVQNSTFFQISYIHVCPYKFWPLIYHFCENLNEKLKYVRSKLFILSILTWLSCYCHDFFKTSLFVHVHLSSDLKFKAL
jgi:hypothetical protein